ncbi:hypothetical protein JCM8547_001404 [Rhodosporidiobolus lusitaniae]
MTSQTTLDLQHARSLASFSDAALHPLLPSPLSSRKTSVLAVLEADPLIAQSKREKPYFPRKKQLEGGLRVMRRLVELREREKWGEEEFKDALALIDEPLGFNLHYLAFLPVIASQGSDEQQKEWITRCERLEVIGCYLQTELGHGSNVAKLETTAIYDPTTDSFILNSPTVSSTKWWIGGLGVLATHGVVQARLILRSEDLGPHLFIVQLRSLDDHSLLPGIQAGDIGPKVHGAGSALDNGWARFSSVRLSRSSMLSRFARLEPTQEGDVKYVKPPHAKLAYGSMVHIRAKMISALAWRLAKGVTISTRYLFQRRQFSSSSTRQGGQLEKQVINYPSVYMRIVPEVNNAFVFMLAGKEMSTLYSRLSASLATGDPSLLAETHAISSCLKVYVSSAVVAGLETVRRAMGGHGFLASTGVGRIWADELPSVTYEGDNGILNLQVARAALKAFATFTSSSPSSIPQNLTPFSSFVSALSPSPSLPLAPPSASDLSSLPYLTSLFRLRASLTVARFAALMSGPGGENKKEFDELSHETVEVAQTVTESWLAERVVEAVSEGGVWGGEGVGEREREVMKKVVHSWLLHRLSLSLSSLLTLSIFHPQPAPSLSQPSSFTENNWVETLRSAVDSSARFLVPELAGLTDAFGFSNWELHTTVGIHDGGAYDRLFEKAKADEELNLGTKEEQRRRYEEYIKPVLERGRRVREEKERREAKL